MTAENKMPLAVAVLLIVVLVFGPFVLTLIPMAMILLEPDLGDPRVNAGALNNPDLPYVKLRVYMRTTGATPALFTGDLQRPSGGAGR